MFLSCRFCAGCVYGMLIALLYIIMCTPYHRPYKNTVNGPIKELERSEIRFHLSWKLVDNYPSERSAQFSFAGQDIQQLVERVSAT